MADWTAFGAVAGLVLALVLALARVTTSVATDRAAGSHRPPDRGSLAGAAPPRDGEAGGDPGEPVPGPSASHDREHSTRRPVTDRAQPAPNGAAPTAHPAIPTVSTAGLLVNVVVTHGVFAAVLLGAAALTAVPATTLGVTDAAWSTGWPAVAAGLALGAALAGVNTVLAATLDRFGVEHSEDLRAALAPDGPVGWVALLVLILPMVAIFEELLFRAVLVGAAGAATGVSAWVFALLSSVAFAMGHGIQGRAGLVVTGLLGLVLAGAFVVTHSLLLVVVAHYVVNAVEFVWKEGIGGAGVGA